MPRVEGLLGTGIGVERLIPSFGVRGFEPRGRSVPHLACQNLLMAGQALLVGGGVEWPA